MAAPTREEIRQAFEELRDAVRQLVEVDPQRALLYVRSAACSVESWVRALGGIPKSQQIVDSWVRELQEERKRSESETSEDQE